MPSMTYEKREVEAAVRLGWVTGVRDVLTMLQGGPLDDDQVRMLTPLMSPSALREMVQAVLRHGETPGPKARA